MHSTKKKIVLKEYTRKVPSVYITVVSPIILICQFEYMAFIAIFITLSQYYLLALAEFSLEMCMNQHHKN